MNSLSRWVVSETLEAGATFVAPFVGAARAIADVTDPTTAAGAAIWKPMRRNLGLLVAVSFATVFVIGVPHAISPMAAPAVLLADRVSPEQRAPAKQEEPPFESFNFAPIIAALNKPLPPRPTSPQSYAGGEDGPSKSDPAPMLTAANTSNSGGPAEAKLPGNSIVLVRTDGDGNPVAVTKQNISSKLALDLSHLLDTPQGRAAEQSALRAYLRVSTSYAQNTTQPGQPPRIHKD